MKKIILLLLIMLVSCSIGINDKELKKERTFLGYTSDLNNDMVLLLNSEVYLTTVNDELKQDLITTATDLITKYHKLLDSHHYYQENNKLLTNIKVLNDSIDKGPIVVDEVLLEAIKEAINLTKLTKGYFNITLFNVSSLYNDLLLPYDTIKEDPNKTLINDNLKDIISYEQIDEYIIIDKDKSTIELKSKNNPYKLDLGAFSKGFIINKVYKELTKFNTSFLLDAGSSSIVAYNNEDENITWTVGIKDPNSPLEELFTFNLKNSSISSSGDYEKYYFLKDGTRRHHILNPFTGYSENYYRSNTLITDNAGIIDALSTALFNIEDINEIKNIINDTEQYYNINISYLFIKDENNIFMNQEFNNLLNNKSNKINDIEIIN